MEISRIIPYLGFLGTILCLIGLGLPLIYTGPISSLLITIGVVCLVAYLIYQMKRMVHPGQRRSAKLGLHSLGSLVLAAIVAPHVGPSNTAAGILVGRRRLDLGRQDPLRLPGQRRVGPAPALRDQRRRPHDDP